MSNIALPLILAFALLVGGSAAVSAAGALVGSVNAAFDATAP